MREQEFQELRLAIRKRIGSPYGFEVPCKMKYVEMVLKKYFRHYGRGVRKDQKRVYCGKKSLISWKFGGDVILLVCDGDLVEILFSKKIEKWVKFFLLRLFLKREFVLRKHVERCRSVDDLKLLTRAWLVWREENKRTGIRFGTWLGEQQWMQKSLPFWRRRVFLTRDLQRSMRRSGI